MMIPTMLAMLLRFDHYAGLRRMTVLRCPPTALP
jgi:hypothetical protein